MKGRVIAGLLAVVALPLVLLLLRSDPRDAGRDEVVRRHAPGGEGASGQEQADADAAPRPPRMSERPDREAPRPTHGPQQLKDFRLPSLEIEGKTLAEALELVRGEYRRICDLSGEVGLDLRFELPAGGSGPLAFTLPAGSLDTSIRYLAAMSGLRVTREGKVYRFEEEVLAGPVERRFAVPPDFLSRLEGMGGGDPGSDPETRMQFFPGNSTIQVTSSSGADLARIEGLVKAMSGEVPVQTKLRVKLLELPVGDEPPDHPTSMGDTDFEFFLREMAGRKGTDLKTMPEITARPGDHATMEFIRELIAPDPANPGEYVKHELGTVLDFTPQALGFGHGLEFHYTDTAGGLVDGRAEVGRRVELADDVFLGDQQARVFRYRRDDGSSTLLVLNPTLLDATGRPVRRADE